MRYSWDISYGILDVNGYFTAPSACSATTVAMETAQQQKPSKIMVYFFVVCVLNSGFLQKTVLRLTESWIFWYFDKHFKVGYFDINY